MSSRRYDVYEVSPALSEIYIFENCAAFMPFYAANCICVIELRFAAQNTAQCNTIVKNTDFFKYGVKFHTRGDMTPFFFAFIGTIMSGLVVSVMLDL